MCSAYVCRPWLLLLLTLTPITLQLSNATVNQLLHSHACALQYANAIVYQYYHSSNSSAVKLHSSIPVFSSFLMHKVTSIVTSLFILLFNFLVEELTIISFLLSYATKVSNTRVTQYLQFINLLRSLIVQEFTSISSLSFLSSLTFQCKNQPDLHSYSPLMPSLQYESYGSYYAVHFCLFCVALWLFYRLQCFLVLVFKFSYEHSLTVFPY